MLVVSKIVDNYLFYVLLLSTFTNTYVFLISLGMNTIKQRLKPYAGIGICASSSLFSVCAMYLSNI